MLQTMNECISYLENQVPQKIDLSLDRIIKAATYLDNPQNKYKTIHITGTNGKGSTSAFTSQLLTSQGLRVGLFTSPHLRVYNERICINGEMISDFDFIASVNQLITDVLPHVQLTLFECITLVGYSIFAKKKVDVAVIEVGLGGRYDATNIIIPTIACITNISVDHVQFLSDDPLKIAKEKAGIFKQAAYNIHTVDDESLHPVFSEEVESTYISPFISFLPHKRGFHISVQYDDLTYVGDFPMYGLHQIRNLEAAIAIVISFLNLENQPLQIERFSEQIQNLTWKGRMERLQHNVYFDGAHNNAGIDALIQTIETHFRDESVYIIFSVMKDKDYGSMLDALLSCQWIQHVYFCALPIERSLQEIPENFVSSSKISKISYTEISRVLQENQTTILAGSLYGYELVSKVLNKEGD